MTPKFTTPCFIRKNTPELRKKLEKLGYYKHPSCLVDKTDNQFLFCNRGMFAELLIGYTEEVNNAIDCGTNEQLFIAVAALREDSDKKQWFTNGKEWKLCPIENVNQFIEWEMQGFHKATPEELIEHFNKK